MKNLLIGVVIILVLIVAGIFLFSPPAPPVYHSDASPVLYFYGANCHFCIQQKPILEKLASEGFRVNVIDVAKNQALVENNQIAGTPSFVAENGEKLTGLQEEATLRDWLQAHGAKIA